MTELMKRGEFSPVFFLVIMTISVANHHQRVSGVPSGMFAPGKFNG